MMLTEYEVRIVGLDSRSKEEIQAFQQQLDTLSLSDGSDMKDLLPCIQEKMPIFNNDKQRRIFLRLLRQMRLAWRCISKIKGSEPTHTNIIDALARRRRGEKWLSPELGEKTNIWSNLDIEIVPHAGKNSAFKKIFTTFLGYISGEDQQCLPIPT